MIVAQFLWQRMAMLLLFICTLTTSTLAQTTSFTYQGRLADGGAPANATYQLQFKLFDALPDGSGTQVGPTITDLTTLVTNGVFTVQLDFGSNAFNGSARYLEIGVRPNGSANPYTILSPRQQITSSPYSIRSNSAALADNATNATTATNATQLGGVAANQYVVTSDSRLSDARAPTPGSANYIQNTTVQQAGGNFNISGNGQAGGRLTANLVDSATQYNIAGSPVLSVAGISNSFVGLGAGAANTAGNSNSFFGASAGGANTSGNANSFFGANVGAANSTGSGNAFFGSSAGAANNTGNFNAFFGTTTGQSNTTGSDNSFFGIHAGFSNTTGGQNSFFGRDAGLSNAGSQNSFFGFKAGNANTTGASNSFFGNSAGAANTGGILNTFVGDSAGFKNTNGADNSFFGDEAGFQNTTGSNNAFFGDSAGVGNTTGSNNTFIGQNAGNPDTATQVSFSTAIGAGASVTNDHQIVLGTSAEDVIVPGSVRVETNMRIAANTSIGGFLSFGSLDIGGQTQLCRNTVNFIATCSSSLRYKTAIAPFNSGLNLLQRLLPISFTWKEGGMRDLGFGAEDVAKVEPLLVTRNEKGEVEGVKYDRLSAVFVNAFKEQQAQIVRQQKQIEQEQRQLVRLQQEMLVLRQSVSRRLSRTKLRRR